MLLFVVVLPLVGLVVLLNEKCVTENRFDGGMKLEQYLSLSFSWPSTCYKCKRRNKICVSLLALEYTYMTSFLCQQIFLKNIKYLQGFQLILSRFNLGLITSIIPKYSRAVASSELPLKIYLSRHCIAISGSVKLKETKKRRR